VTHPFPYPGDDIDALLQDVGATPDEAAHLRQVLQEAEAEEAAGLPQQDPDPWGTLAGATEAMDARYAADAQLDAERAAADVTDALARRPSAEDKLARAMQRAAEHTLLPAPAFRGDPAAPDGYAGLASACGPLTDLGTCAARYHDPGCGAVIAAAAAAGDAAEAEAWAATLAARPPDPGTLGYSAELAEPSGPEDTFADLLSPRASASPAAVHARMLAALDGTGTAEPGYEPFPPEQMPDVSTLRGAMGL
jgi:hypothetical protein